MQTTGQSPRRPPSTAPVTPAAHDTELVDSMADFLDEIDDVLDQEAEFLQRYHQRGGQ